MKNDNNNALDAGTELYAVFGSPVSHSLGPVMHNRAFSSAGINAIYLAFNVTDIAAALRAVRTLNIRGVSITIPHKVAAMRFLDEVDDMALKIGAVNTVVNDGGVLRGCNTDCRGAIQALREKTDIRNKRVAIIGAGGAARAIGFGIQEAGGRLTIINRSPDNGAALAKALDADFVPLPDIGRADADILINTTPAGMTPNISDAPAPEACLKEGMTVMDIIYNPLATRLLRTARARGCAAVDGVSMFVNQGALQFELWTGRKAPVELMKHAVLAALTHAEQKG